MPADPRVSHVWHKFVLLTEARNELADALMDQGIPTRVHYDRPLPMEAMFEAEYGTADVPNAMEYCRRTLSLPIHSHMDEGEVNHVIAAVRAFFS